MLATGCVDMAPRVSQGGKRERRAEMSARARREERMAPARQTVPRDVCVARKRAAWIVCVSVGRWRGDSALLKVSEIVD